MASQGLPPLHREPALRALHGERHATALPNEVAERDHAGVTATRHGHGAEPGLRLRRSSPVLGWGSNTCFQKQSRRSCSFVACSEKLQARA